MNNKSIPIIFGVTGHRDLRQDDIPKLKSQVSEIFKEYQKKYPHTELIIMSALAEGADMLVAEVAEEIGITRHIVLPYDETAYLRSFDNQDECVAQYKKLIDNAYKDTTLSGCDYKNNVEDCYQQLGEYIANNCNILIALWDGETPRDKKTGEVLRGGTAAIVRYTREGNKNNQFDVLDGNALFLIKTPRQINPEIEEKFKVEKEYLGLQSEKNENRESSFFETLKEINEINKEFARFKDISNENTLISNAFLYFDNTAKSKQKIFKVSFVLILIFSWLAFASLEIMHVLHIEGFTFGYGIGLLLAFLGYFLIMRKGKIQSDFVYSRGLAEALRVQNAWNKEEIPETVAKYFLSRQQGKFTWLKIALKNISFLDKNLFVPEYEEAGWVQSQIDYLKDNGLKDRKKNLHMLEKIEKVLYISGLVVLFVMFVLFYLYFIHDYKITLGFIDWHHLVLVSGLLLLTAAFIGEKYIKIQGYEEEIYNFELALSNFEAAKVLLEKKENQELDKVKEIIRDLGVKALDESSKWVVLHDNRRAKPSVD